MVFIKSKHQPVPILGAYLLMNSREPYVSCQRELILNIECSFVESTMFNSQRVTILLTGGQEAKRDNGHSFSQQVQRFLKI